MSGPLVLYQDPCLVVTSHHVFSVVSLQSSWPGWVLTAQPGAGAGHALPAATRYKESFLLGPQEKNCVTFANIKVKQGLNDVASHDNLPQGF